jgi:hypothetical protein
LPNDIFNQLPALYEHRLRAYFMNHADPGWFLKCILANDLFSACSCGGPTDENHMRPIGLFLKTFGYKLPPQSYGSWNFVNTWAGKAPEERPPEGFGGTFT